MSKCDNVSIRIYSSNYTPPISDITINLNSKFVRFSVEKNVGKNITEVALASASFAINVGISENGVVRLKTLL